MKVHALSTGTVQITQNWMIGQGEGPMRLARTLFDTDFTEDLPIFCYVIEHPEGLIVVDTGIPADANRPVYFPPYMRLIQRAARFDMSPEQEIGSQMRRIDLEPQDVRWVVLTHLHQDHEGGLHHFPNAEFVIARREWQAARGLKGRLGGYLNHRWPEWLSPTLVEFTGRRFGPFPEHQTLTRAGDVHLVPTPGHSAGHMSVIVEEEDHVLFLAGDASYSQELLRAGAVDGIGPSPALQRETHHRMRTYAAEQPTVFLPSHEWDARRRLAAREPIFTAEAEKDASEEQSPAITV